MLPSFLPDDTGVCLRVEASTFLGDDGDLCYWGALSVFDPVANAPYFIGTTASAPPTPIAQSYLGETVPDPQPAKTCECDTLPHPAVCCETATTPAEFWDYSIQGQAVFPGDSVALPMFAPNGDAVSFEVSQAQSIPACDGDPLQLSWAVIPPA